MFKIENWCGHDIRFVEIDGEWWAILKDICDALRLRTDAVANRLDPDMLERVQVEMDINYDRDMPSRYIVKSEGGLSDHSSNGVRSVDRHPSSNGVTVRNPRSSSGTVKQRRWMLAINEIGIYEALFASRRLEARKFRRWSASVMQRLRREVGLEQYEVMKMTYPEVQEDIDHILDTLFYDEETGCLMRSVTIQGGDVDQVPFFE